MQRKTLAPRYPPPSPGDERIEDIGDSPRLMPTLEFGHLVFHTSCVRSVAVLLLAFDHLRNSISRWRSAREKRCDSVSSCAGQAFV
jgi:hypothetical protein